jgi:hypothetical protein
MGYAVDLGKQQITIYPYQDLTSINGDQILLNLFTQGVHECEVQLVDGNDLGAPVGMTSDEIGILLKKGTTFLFESEVTDTTLTPVEVRPIVVKFVLNEDTFLDGENYLAKATIWKNDSSFTNAEFLFVYAQWSYELDIPANRYAKFFLGTDASYETIRTDGVSIILCKILNHQHFVTHYDSGLDLELGHYQISYETKEDRNYLNLLKETLNQFIVEFDGDGENITVKAGTVVAGNTVLKKTSSTIAAPAAAVGGTSTDFQVDVLRYRYGNEDNTTMTPVLEWESFIFARPSNWASWVWTDAATITEDMITTYLNGKRLDVTDAGYNVLYLVRSWSVIGATSVMWPGWCYIPTATTPRVGAVETTTRLSVPIYD